LWWFARLEAAVERQDQQTAAVAVQELARLGIEVRFLLPPLRRETEVSRAS
jgi:hypothetical protein